MAIVTCTLSLHSVLHERFIADSHPVVIALLTIVGGCGPFPQRFGLSLLLNLSLHSQVLFGTFASDKLHFTPSKLVLAFVSVGFTVQLHCAENLAYKNVRNVRLM